MKFLAVVVIAIVVEGITEYLKLSFPQLSDKTGIICLVTVILGIGTALTFNADVFDALGIAARVPYVGCVLTGVLCARGSNYVYDIIGKFTEAEARTASLEVPADEVEYEALPSPDDSEG